MSISDHRKLLRKVAYEEIADRLKDAITDRSIDECLMQDGFLNDERDSILNIVESEIAKYQQKAEAFNA